MAIYDLGKVAITHKGTWSNATEYTGLDMVYHNGGSYVALATSTNVEPGVTASWTDYWVDAAKGINSISITNPSSGMIRVSITFNDGTSATAIEAPTGELADRQLTLAKLANNFVLPIEQGGTNATSASAARHNLGLDLPLAITSGGTGATSAAAARTNLGINPLVVESGGTGATTAEGARANLGIDLPIAVTRGGTGATTVADARHNLGIDLPLAIASGGTGATTVADARHNLGIDFPLSIANGGTGASDAATARANLGISFPLSIANGGTGATQVEGEGGVLDNLGISFPIPINKGGTGATTASAARTALFENQPLAVSEGGTGATTAAEARANLGFNLPLPIASGGTGATTAAGAFANIMQNPLEMQYGGTGASYASLDALIAGRNLFKKLWANANPTVAFVTQTVNVGAYAGYIVFFNGAATYIEDGETLTASGMNDTLMCSRTVTSNGANMTFGGGNYYATYGSSTATADDSKLIPLAVYGVGALS